MAARRRFGESTNAHALNATTMATSTCATVAGRRRVACLIPDDIPGDPDRCPMAQVRVGDARLGG